MLVISCDIQTLLQDPISILSNGISKIHLPGQCSPKLLHGGAPKIIVHVPRNPYVSNLLQDSTC